MKTYQDWLEVANKSETERINFIRTAITEHQASRAYHDALIGEDYFNGQNTTIRRLEKFIFNAKGQAVPDYISANHKLANRFFYRSVLQATSVLLGNGVTWSNDEVDTNAMLGKTFHKDLMQVVRLAQTEGTSFAFWNLDHMEVYSLSNYVPFYDEEDGALKAGIRFWQIADNKPMRATVMELDGYEEYIFRKGNGEVLKEKQAYIQKTLTSEADGTEIYEGENYPTFPVIPCYANATKTSDILPIRNTIDAYDLIASGYANDIDDANIIYWTITNAGGMDDSDLTRVLDKLRKLHMAQLDDDQQIQSHSVDVSYAGREAILDRLEQQLYKDAMALNTYDLASGAVTATQIQAAYEPLNQKLDMLESFVTDFLKRLIYIIGIEDDPTYDRSIVVNKTEEVNTLVNSALYLDEDYVTEKIMTLFGDQDKIDDVMNSMDRKNLNRMSSGTEGKETQTV